VPYTNLTQFDHAVLDNSLLLLREGRSSKLYLAESKIIVIKELLERDIWDKFKSILWGSRARRAWRANEFLKSSGFNVLEVVDIVENSAFFRSERSLLVTRYHENSSSLAEFFSRVSGRIRRYRVIRHLALEVAKMHTSGFAHDDMNLGNILLSSDDCRLIWTDVERVRKSISGKFGIYSSQSKKNLRQLAKLEVGLSKKEMVYFLKCYLKHSEVDWSRCRIDDFAKLSKSSLF